MKPKNWYINLAIFAAVMGIILITFGILIYFVRDHEGIQQWVIFGTVFISVGSGMVIIAVCLVLITPIKKRFAQPRIVDDPRISYFYDQVNNNYYSPKVFVNQTSSSFRIAASDLAQSNIESLSVPNLPVIKPSDDAILVQHKIVRILTL